MKEDRKFKSSLFVLILFHVVGMIGMLSPYHQFFVLLTPFNLMLSAFLLYLNHQPVSSRLLYFFLFVFSFGFLVEGLGVNYGFLFGDYHYSHVLGYQFWNVPMIIGLNWALIIYSVAVMVDRYHFPIVAKIMLGSILAVFLDWLIEPVAVQFDFWRWMKGEIPIQNFVGWFFTSVVMLGGYYLLKVQAKNKLAFAFYLTEIIFFSSLQLTMYLLK